MFDAVLATAPDAEAFVDGDERITFVDWAARADGLAGHLADRGVGRGDVVCFQLTSCIDYAVAYQAVMRLGAITSGVNPRLGRAEVESIITRAEPKVVITDAGLADTAPIPAGPWQVIDRQIVRDAPPAIHWRGGCRPSRPTPSRSSGPAAPPACPRARCSTTTASAPPPSARV